MIIIADEIQFVDNRARVMSEMKDAITAFLHTVGGELQSQTIRNTRVKTGQTKGSWGYVVDEGEQTVTVGSTLENAIWEEFGTGEYALNGDGRKGGWFYVDEDGNGHFTHGKAPTRALFHAFESTKPRIQSRLEDELKGLND